MSGACNSISLRVRNSWPSLGENSRILHGIDQLLRVAVWPHDSYHDQCHGHSRNVRGLPSQFRDSAVACLCYVPHPQLGVLLLRHLLQPRPPANAGPWPVLHHRKLAGDHHRGPCVFLKTRVVRVRLEGVVKLNWMVSSHAYWTSAKMILTNGPGQMNWRSWRAC